MKDKKTVCKNSNRIIWLIIPLALIVAFWGAVAIFAHSFFEDVSDITVWQGFDKLEQLNKLSLDFSVVNNIDEDEAEKFIEQNMPSDSEKDQIPELPELFPNNSLISNDHVLKETITANGEYYEDTLFLGDSRMLGLGMTCADLGATFYAGVGLSVSQLDTREVIKIDSETTYTVMDAIKNDGKNYKRIYMMFGLNELGWTYPSVFVRAYKNAMEQLAELCPEAEFCIISIIPISSETKVSLYYGAEANARIREYNSLLLDLASEKKCWYLDTYSYFSDEYGNLPEVCAADGIHMYSRENIKLINFISRHLFAT